MHTFDLSDYGIKVQKVLRNASPAVLCEEAIRYEKGAALTDTGALVAYSGEKTGRCPKDKRIVKHKNSEGDIWWGEVNIPLEERIFSINYERAVDYLNTRERLYVVDGFAGWDPKYRIKVRVICSRPYHALFMHNMLIRPEVEELAGFGEPDYVIINAGEFPANSHTDGMTSKTSVALSFERKAMVILGTEYAGEMKKGGVHNHELPDAQAGAPFHALLGHGGEGWGAFFDFVRLKRNGKNNTVCRSKATSDRR